MEEPLLKSVAIVLLSLAGCTYEANEIYYKEIPPVDHTITFVLNKYDKADTIFLTGPEYFSFEVNITPGEIERVELVLGDQVLLTSMGGKINFPFDGDLLKTGVYDFTIRFTAKEGTGSLAESTGGERLFVSRKWILKIQV